MKRFLLVCFLLGLISLSASGQIAQWTFETSIPNTAGPHAAEVGTGSASGFHTSGSAVYSNPAGNGSAESFSSNNWTTVGDYYQFQFATSGYNTLSITWDHTSSGTGPRDFKVQYSTDGSSFTDATGTNSTYTITGETWSAGSGNPASTRTLNLSGVAALQNAPAVYIRLVSTSLINVGGGAIAAAGSSRVDNFTVNANIISSNTITVGLLSTATFNIDCFTDGTGMIDFTSSGTFNAGNIYNAELSDATGSFAAPTVVGSLTSTANSGTINITIPAGTPTGAGYLIRIISTSPVVTSSNTSVTININLSGTCISLATDYFRSKTTGNWNVTTTWQSSATGVAGTWINATLTPTSAANTIQIRNGHTVSITSLETADQLIIESGGILIHSSNTFTIDDGSGDDVDIQNGGVFTLASTAPPAFGAGSPTVNIATGGILRVSASGMTAAAPANGVNASNYVYQDASILEYTLSGGFTTSNVTYFPNVNATTIPIFRATNPTASNLIVGSGNPTVFNGVFEYTSSTADLIWQNAGNKTFRNGIRGNGNFTSNASAANAKFIINGTTAEIGGTGSLVVPTTGGLEIGASTTVTLLVNKTVTGNIALLNNTYVQLGNFDLTVTGTVSNATVTSYIKTNGTGKLVLNNVGSGASAKLFPIGLTSINPLFISSPSTGDYSARVVEPITPPIYDLNQAVQRSWYISSSLNSPGATISFGYSYPGDCGGLYNNSGPVELGVNVSGVWSRHQSTLTPTAFAVVPGTYIVTPILPISYFNNPATEFGFAIANNGAILALDCLISTRAQKRNNTGIINWTVNSCSEVNNFEVQRAVSNSAYQTIGVINPAINQTDFNFTDPSLAKGTNLYRIKVNGRDGSFKYSNTVALIYESDALISSVIPNPVHAMATLTLSADRSGIATFQVYNMSGNKVKEWRSNFAEGNSTIEMDVSALPAGFYQVLVSTPYSKTTTSFIKN